MRVKLRSNRNLLPHKNINNNSKFKLTHNNEYKRTRCLFTANTKPIPYIHQCRVVIAIDCSVLFGQDMMRVTLRPRTASNTNSTAQFNCTHSNQYKRTCCSSMVNTAPVPYIRPAKINAGPLSTVQSSWCIRKAKRCMRVKLRPHTASNASNTGKSEHAHPAI